MNEQQLLDLKRRIAEAKQKKAQYQGAMDSVLIRLDGFGCASIEEAEARELEIINEVAELDELIDEKKRALARKLEEN